MLMVLVAQIVVLMAFEGTKQGWYVLPMTPILSAVLAVWITYLFSLHTRLSITLAGIHLAVLLLGVASLGIIIRERKYQREYMPVVAFLNSQVQPPQVVFGRSELYFGLQCKTCLKDDERLGAKSGKHADFIVLDSDYKQTINSFSVTEKDTYKFIQDLLVDKKYSPVFRTHQYEVLQKQAE